MLIENDAANPGALIVDGHGHTDLGVARALGMADVPVYVATTDPHSPVRFSRYVRDVFLLPGDAADEIDKIKALREIGRRFKHRPVLFSTGDGSLMLLSRHRVALEHFYHHHLAAPDLVERLNDKRLFAQLAEQHGFPVPRTVVPVDRDHLLSEIPMLRFPVFVKPGEKQNWARYRDLERLTGGSLKGVKLESAVDLVRFYDSLARYDSRVVVQEYIEGRDEQLWSFYAYVDRYHYLRAWALSQKIRTNPPHRGVGTFSVTRSEPRITDLAARVLSTVGFTGQAILQVKWSEPHRDYLVLEINARHGTSVSLYPAAGVNMPFIAYCDSLGLRVPPAPEQREGIRWIDVAGDLVALRQYRALGEWGLARFLWSYLGRNTFARFSWSDPAPLLAPVWRRLRRKSGKLAQRVWGVAKP